MNTQEACQIIAKHSGEETLAVTTMSAMRAWNKIRPSEFNFSVVPMMGAASAIALGLAMAQPRRKIVVLDGDGSLLMQLGSLATVAGVHPDNYFHFVFNNGVWFEGAGNIRLPNADRMRYSDAAVACGYNKAYVYSEASDLDKELTQIFSERGPVFIELRLDPKLGERGPWSAKNPQSEILDAQFSKMGKDAQQVRKALMKKA